MILPRHLRLPRALLLWWSLWLLASWITAFGWRWGMQPSIAMYMTASKRMMLSVMLGVTIIWPLYRLVLRPAHTPRLLPLLDWAAIFATLQVLLWPMRVPTQWSALDVLLIDLTIFAWGLLYAALIAIGTAGAGRRHRALMMLVCIAIAAAAPLAAATSSTFDTIAQSDWLHWSPITSLWLHISRTTVQIEPQAWQRTAIVAAAALLVWLGLMLWPVKTPPRRGRSAPTRPARPAY
ncbi:MAG: hypothetical protein IT430_10050 [Phycisphaerales bacterium]|nr:hypothetical protein [Phycisphaerales bacterium]